MSGQLNYPMCVPSIDRSSCKGQCGSGGWRLAWLMMGMVQFQIYPYINCWILIGISFWAMKYRYLMVLSRTEENLIVESYPSAAPKISSYHFFCSISRLTLPFSCHTLQSASALHGQICLQVAVYGTGKHSQLRLQQPPLVR